MSTVRSILQDGDVDVWMRPYSIVAISPDSGIIEAVTDTISLDALKKHADGHMTLLDFFTQQFGDVESARFIRARENFVRSMAAYCIACYILQIKDRCGVTLLPFV